MWATASGAGVGRRGGMEKRSKQNWFGGGGKGGSIS